MHIVSREEMQAIDHYAIETIGLQGAILMENAGRAIFQKLLPLLKKEDRIGVIIGKGNNGGDGFVIARCLMEKSFQTDVWVVPAKKELTGDAQSHMGIYFRAGGTVRFIQDEHNTFLKKVNEYTVVIDALLGTGVHGEPRSPYLGVIQSVNQSQAMVAAVDLPSGVPANGGQFTHEAVQADHTYTLQCPKLAMYTKPAAAYFGTSHIVDIGIPNIAFREQEVLRRLWTREDVLTSLPKREAFSHKGAHGKGLLIAGSTEMPGAAALAAKGALRSGIGLLTISTPEEIWTAVSTHAVEATYVSRDDIQFDHYDGIALGPGLGREKSTAHLVKKALSHDDIPLLIDADGLFHLKSYIKLLKKRQAPVVITPHPGEMARLTGLTIKEIENNRFQTAKAFAVNHGIYVVLKGKYTVISTPDGNQFVNDTGNAALAKGGTGDVLTGMIFAFMFQHQSLLSAICNAVHLHGMVAEHLTLHSHSKLDVLASDVTQAIPVVLHNFYRDTVC
ncbi:NAD(P)H-hydrate epimerase [Scopulibacillus darangshiensis]|uniref:Bifunctional NAD(P)H-hydrate repair enzyme n=1 Tax=Scopulibacillus darangshiensis TaxID=442528 RepID=A0A4R2NQT2_9BACL|nr:NAD(P)H-hydrate dehydratase [Scopulibacillus darangshiensis]TCP23821.1 NAD(P)H-hydrate epimerase [Scopulibacillus darangshiensis]